MEKVSKETLGNKDQYHFPKCNSCSLTKKENSNSSFVQKFDQIFGFEILFIISLLLSVVCFKSNKIFLFISIVFCTFVYYNHKFYVSKLSFTTTLNYVLFSIMDILHVIILMLPLYFIIYMNYSNLILLNLMFIFLVLNFLILSRCFLFVISDKLQNTNTNNSNNNNDDEDINIKSIEKHSEISNIYKIVGSFTMHPVGKMLLHDNYKTNSYATNVLFVSFVVLFLNIYGLIVVTRKGKM